MTNKNKHKLFGIVMTIAFHAVALVLLLNLCFITPLPLPGEAGVEVNLGMYAQGLGKTSENVASQPVPETPKVVEQQEAHAEDVEEILSEDEEVPSIEEVPEEIEEIEEKPEEIEEPKEVEKIEELEEIEEVEEPIEEKPEEKPVVNQRAMFQAPKNNTESSSEGNTQPGGIQGSPNGLKDIDRYEGNGGSGGGPAYDLGGRGAKSIASPSRENVSEEGKVVVDIWVDKEGRVQRTEIGKGTTITNSEMRALALQAAKNSIFNKDENAAELQRGTITYTFIIRQ
ncbi:MAG: energy transducer TonB [Bacteroidales bacterium]|nr:energy transducer TonB [Bacteroidales bacterium]